MTQMNPYSPPTANVADEQDLTAANVERLNRVASAQSFMVIAVIVVLVATITQPMIGPLALVASLVSGIMAVVSVIRLGLSLGTSGVMCFLLAVLMFIPLVNLLIMASLSARATKKLRASGYHVGFFGAKARAIPVPGGNISGPG